MQHLASIRSVNRCGALVLLATLCTACVAQSPDLVVPQPAPEAVRLIQDLTYRTLGKEKLALDAFLPTHLQSEKLPVVIIFNGFGGSYMRTSPQAHAWARLAATHGFVAITADTSPDRLMEDFDALVAYLKQHEPDFHVDSDRVTIIAWSGNVQNALRTIEDPTRKSVKAAVILYGAADLSSVRMDLPVLFVRAGLDQPALNTMVESMLSRVIAENGPWTIVNYPAGHHGFDIRDANDLSRDIIEMSFSFLSTATNPSRRAALLDGAAEASAAGALSSRNYDRAVELYATLAKAHPQNAEIAVAYGIALTNTHRFREARAQFDRAKQIGGIGARDLGLPAARASALDGDADSAMQWLKSIPPQFIPASLIADPDFSILKNRPDFLQIFDHQRN